MNFNASRNVAQSGGIRKAKRVSDVAAMGAPSPAPTFSPSPAYNPGYPAAPTPAAPYSESIQLDSQDFNTPGVAQNYGFMGGFPATPPQIGTMLQQPIVQDMALQYGNRLANEGKAVVTRELGRLVPVSRLRYYFAVDTRYVLRKLLLIAFPYTHKEWMVKYDQELPVQPRYDLNAPDLYIPSMGYVTYVLLAGFMLGLQHRFSPEQIGMQASSALAYIACEVALYMFTLYISGAGAGAGAGTLDLLAHSGYKYCVMIASLLAALLLGPTAYYCCLAFGSFSLSFFLVRTLRVQIMSAPPEQAPYGSYGAQPPYGASPQSPHSPYSSVGSKRRVYFLLFVGVTQPLLCWWLTRHLVPPTALAPLTPLAPLAPLAPVAPVVPAV